MGVETAVSGGASGNDGFKGGRSDDDAGGAGLLPRARDGGRSVGRLRGCGSVQRHRRSTISVGLSIDPVGDFQAR